MVAADFCSKAEILFLPTYDFCFVWFLYAISDLAVRSLNEGLDGCFFVCVLSVVCVFVFWCCILTTPESSTMISLVKYI